MKLRILVKLWRMSRRWTPPPGIHGFFAALSDGTIVVTIAACHGLFVTDIAIPFDRRVDWRLFDELDEAVGIVQAKAEAFALAGEQCAAGIERAGASVTTFPWRPT